MSIKRFGVIKPEIRIIGWDDAAHNRKTKSVLLVGLILRGAGSVDGMLSVRIKKDGLDATEKIANSIQRSRHFDQLSIIMLDGITFGGFNLVDIHELQSKTKLPVIAVQRKLPNMSVFKSSIKKAFKDWTPRLRIVEKAGKISKYSENGCLLYYQKAGIDKESAEKILKLTCVRGNVPGPLRVAHLVAGGWFLRRSRGL